MFAIAATTTALVANQQCMGNGSYSTETIESLDFVGSVKLNGTTISKQLKVVGNLVAYSAHLHQVEVVGNTRLVDTIIESEIHLIGPLQAICSDFQASITLVSQKTLFSGCTLKGISVQRDGAFKGKLFLELKDKTIVDGPIYFDGGGGEVLLYSGSKVFGPVSGGKLIFKN